MDQESLVCYRKRGLLQTIHRRSKAKLSTYIAKIRKHAKIAPQNVYKCLTNCVQYKLTFLSRTTSDTFDLLEEAEEVINNHLIPKLVCNTNYVETYRYIFSIPVREGGLNIIGPQNRVLKYKRLKLFHSRYPSGTYQMSSPTIKKS